MKINKIKIKAKKIKLFPFFIETLSRRGYVIKEKNQIANKTNMDLKIVDLDGKNVVASNLIRVNFFSILKNCPN